MCKFCENFYKDYRELKLGDIFITQSAKYTQVGDGKEHNIPMNFCPHCGSNIKNDS